METTNWPSDAHPNRTTSSPHHLSTVPYQCTLRHHPTPPHHQAAELRAEFLSEAEKEKNFREQLEKQLNEEQRQKCK